MEIGEPQRVIEVEPLELPVGSPDRMPQAEPVRPERIPDPAKVPVTL